MHKSVLLKETIENLHINESGKYIDATLGYGGHSLEILKLGGSVLGIEADPKMLALAQKRIKDEGYHAKFETALGNFRDIKKIAVEKNFSEVDGILFDLGISSVHLDDDTRGFSFKNEVDHLDMRLSPETQMVRASDLLNSLSERNLVELFSEGMNFGEAKRLAHEVVRRRVDKRVETVGDMLDITGRVKRGKIHPATKAFMSLRIAVNSEIETLKTALPDAYSLLKKGGVMAVITFHSGEDRVVKNLYRDSEIIVPTEEEINENPRSRSAKLRIIIKK